MARSAGSPFRGDYADISLCKTEGDDIIVICLARPNAALLPRLVELRILPAKLLSEPDKGRAALMRAPIASGPFRLEKWESGVELVFGKNPYYWGEKPRIDKLIWRVIPDKTLLALCLSRGEIDVAPLDAQSWMAIAGNRRERHGVPPPEASDQSVHRIGKDLELERFAGSRTVYLGFNLSCSPFDQLALRRAIGTAIDRQAIAQGLYDGFLICLPQTFHKAVGQ